MKIRLLIIALLFGLTASAQIGDTATLRNYINSNIIPNSTRSITAAQLNYSLIGLLNVSRNYKVDTIYINPTGDSLVYIINSVRRTIKFSVDSLFARLDSTRADHRYIRAQRAVKEDKSISIKGATVDTVTYKGVSAPDVYVRRSSGVVGVPGQSMSWYPSSGTMSYTFWTDPTGPDMMLRLGTAGLGFWIGRDRYSNGVLKVSAQGTVGVNNIFVGKDVTNTNFLWNFMVHDGVPRFAFNDTIPRGPFSFWVNSGMGINPDSVALDLGGQMPLLVLDTVTKKMKRRYISAGVSGLSNLNGLTGAAQTFSTTNTGTDFSISSSGTNHAFNLPDASATARGVVTTGTQTIAGQKTLSDSISFLHSVVLTLLKNVQMLGTDTSGKIVNKTKSFPIVLGDSSGLSNVSGDPAYVFSRMFDPALASNGHGLTVADIFRKNSPNDAFGHADFDARSIVGGTANFDHVAPFQDATEYRGTGTINRQYSFVSVPGIDSGTVSNRIAFYVFDPVVAPGAVLTNNYGLVIPYLSAGSVENFGITSLADVKFSGKVHKKNSTITDTTNMNELRSGTIWQPAMASSAYIVGAANISSEVGLGYYRSFGGSSGYRSAISIRATNTSTMIPALKLMQNGGQVVIRDSVAYVGSRALVVKGSQYVSDSLSINVLAASSNARFHLSGSAQFDLGSDAKYDGYHRDSASGRLTRSPAGTYGQFKYAGPGGIPQWRTLVAGDIPFLPFSQITGTVPISQGGTGLTAIGTPSQQIRVASGGTTLEYFTPSTPTLDQVTTAGNTTSNTITVGGVTNNGNLSNMSGSIRTKYRTAADGETLLLSDHTVSGNTSSGNCTLTLPTGSSYYGIEYYISSSALLNTLTIQTSGGDTINYTTSGNTSLVIPHACIIKLAGAVWTVYSLY